MQPVLAQNHLFRYVTHHELVRESVPRTKFHRHPGQAVMHLCFPAIPKLNAQPTGCNHARGLDLGLRLNSSPTKLWDAPLSTKATAGIPAMTTLILSRLCLHPNSRRDKGALAAPT